MKSSLIIPARFTEEEITKRRNWKCLHNHTGLSHPNCYIKENNIQERKGALDIEAGALDADFDICLSFALKTIGKDEVFYDHITYQDLKEGTYDKRIIETLVNSIWNYDRIITHYGSNFRFDLPFVRARYLWLKSRMLYEGENFPGYGEMYVTDTYSMSKKLLKIHSRRQGSVANLVQAEDIKTRIDSDHWMAIKYGGNKQRKEAINYIVEHNIKDVEQLEGNYLALLPFIRESRTSI